MKKLTLTAIISIIALISYGQDDVYGSKSDPSEKTSTNPKEYKAKNGITYKIGDTVRLGRGSDPQGNFRYLEMGGWGAVMAYNTSKGPEQLNIGRGYSGLAVNIKKIRITKFKGISKAIFVVGGGNITNYNLYIDDAIETCEVTPCNDTKNVNVINVIEKETNLDKLKKLKELLDAGALTQDEYDKQKKKILSEM